MCVAVPHDITRIEPSSGALNKSVNNCVSVQDAENTVHSNIETRSLDVGMVVQQKTQKNMSNLLGLAWPQFVDFTVMI